MLSYKITVASGLVLRVVISVGGQKFHSSARNYK